MFLGWARLPQFRRKVEQAKEVIRESMAIAPSYVACSWGKDSTVLTHLCQSIDPNILVVHWADPMEWMQDSYSEMIRKYMGLSPVTNYMEIIFDPSVEHEASGQNKALEDYPMALVGCRGEESVWRRQSIRKYGLIHRYQSKKIQDKFRCYPMGDWRVNDVWAYLVAENLPWLDGYEHHGRDSRTSVIHNFNLHTDPTHAHRAGKTLTQLKRFAPEYFDLYRSSHPEITEFM